MNVTPSPLQTAFVIYSLFSTDAFNMDVQQLVDKTSFNAVMDTEFRCVAMVYRIPERGRNAEDVSIPPMLK